MYDNKLAVLIKTCKGRTSLIWVVNSVMQSLKDQNYRIYISDEKPLDEWKYKFYDWLNKQGHYIKLHEQGISCGKARNLLIKDLDDEKLVLRMDDDFELGGEFNYSALKAVLESSSEIGFCSDFERQLGHNKGVRSGSIRPAGGEIKIYPPKIIKKFHGPFHKFKKVKEYRYTKAEFTRNLLLCKREIFEKVRWNEQLLFKGEHLEFMISMREKGYIGAYTPDSIHYHRDDLGSYKKNNPNHLSIKKTKKNESMMKKVYSQRWNCTKTATRYPLSWYMIEGGRRLIANILK